MRIIFLALFILLALMQTSLAYEVRLILPEEIKGETFEVLVTVENVSNLAGFQLDISTNTKITAVKKGDAITQWSIFAYNLTDTNARIIGARVKEDPIDGGTLAVLTLKAGNYIKINYSGILVGTGGEKIGEFNNFVEIAPTPKLTNASELATATNTAVSNTTNMPTEITRYWYVPLIILIAIILIWKKRQ